MVPHPIARVMKEIMPSKSRPSLRIRRNFSTLLAAAGLLLSLASCAGNGGGGSRNTMTNRFSLDDDGAVVSIGDGWLKVQAVSDDIIRVAYSNDRQFFSRPSLDVLLQRGIRPDVQSTSDELVLSTARLKAKVNFASGNVTFTDSRGKILLTENGAT